MKKIYQGGYYSGTYEISNILDSIPVESTVGTLTLGIVLGVYAILVGIVIYLILKENEEKRFNMGAYTCNCKLCSQ